MTHHLLLTQPLQERSHSKKAQQSFMKLNTTIVWRGSGEKGRGSKAKKINEVKRGQTKTETLLLLNTKHQLNT